jgi:hypothetical protein
VATPATKPVTTPEVEPTDAIPPEVLHVPPGDELVNVILNPAQTVFGPEIGAGRGFTVSVTVVKQPPPKE